MFLQMSRKMKSLDYFPNKVQADTGYTTAGPQTFEIEVNNSTRSPKFNDNFTYYRSVNQCSQQ